MPKFGDAASRDSLTIADSGGAAAPTTLDPLFESSERSVHLNVFDPLIRTGLQGGGRFQRILYSPWIAESWRSMGDGSQWEIRIRDGVRFHDGTSLTADDVAFSLNHLLDPSFKSRFASQFSGILGAQAKDRLTVTVRTDGIQAATIPMLTRLYIVPRAYYTRVGTRAFAERPVGSGPYKFVSWSRGDQRVALEAFPSYWHGAPAIPRVTFWSVAEAATRVALLKAGQVDLINSVPPVLYEDLRHDSNVAVFVFQSSQHAAIAIDGRKPPFSDVRVRRAMNFAVNRNELISQVFHGFARPVTGAIAQGLPGYDPAVEQVYRYDPAHAKQLLADAGFPNGFSTELMYSPGGLFLINETVQALTGYYQRVGIRVTPVAAETALRLERIRRGEVPGLFQTAIRNEELDADNILGLWFWKGQGTRGFYWPDLNANELIAQEQKELDPKKRVPILAEINKMVVDAAPFIFLYEENEGWAMRKGLQFQPRYDGIILLHNAHWLA